MIELSSVGRVWLRNLWVYRDRWMYGLLPNFFEPLFYLLGLGVGLGFYVSTGGRFEGDYIAFIAPGLVAASAMNGASFETTYNVYVKLQFERLYDAVIATPIGIEDVTVGEIAWGTTRALIYGGIFLLVTLFFDTPVTWRLLAALPALVLVGWAFSSLGLAFTATVPNIELFSYYFTLFITPSFLFSDIFFPVAERFPAWLAAVAQATPLYQSVQLVRGIVVGQWSGTPGHVAYLVLLALAFTSYAVWRMRARMVR